MSRITLGTARSSKKDEFFTMYSDVEFELNHYIDQFRDKIIYCPCDTKESAFVKYFLELKTNGVIKELIYTSLKDGIDCLSDIAIDNYKRCDIVVTNPPFSLFRKFLSLLDSLNKKFIIWGTSNCISYKEFSRMLVSDRIRVGYISNKTCRFEVPKEYRDQSDSKAFLDGGKYFINVPSCSVFTNLSVNKSSKILDAIYNNNYSKYDNYDAINVNRVKDIPIDYAGMMGVPITYLSIHDFSKFKILGVFNNFSENDPESGRISGSIVTLSSAPFKTRGPCVNGKPVYARLIIKKI